MRWPITITVSVLCASALAALPGCGSGNGATPSARHAAPSSLGLSSSAFLNGSSIPSRYTCDGEDVSPPLTWTRAPARTRSLALLVEDPNAPGGEFLHWSVYDLPRGASGIGTARLPDAATEGQNSFGRVGYGGPCPPKGDPAHHYVFSIHALDDNSGLPPGASAAAVRETIAAHAIAEGTLTGLYRR